MAADAIREDKHNDHIIEVNIYSPFIQFISLKTTKSKAVIEHIEPTKFRNSKLNELIQIMFFPIMKNGFLYYFLWFINNLLYSYYHCIAFLLKNLI